MGFAEQFLRIDVLVDAAPERGAALWHSEPVVDVFCSRQCPTEKVAILPAELTDLFNRIIDIASADKLAGDVLIEGAQEYLCIFHNHGKLTSNLFWRDHVSCPYTWTDGGDKRIDIDDVSHSIQRLQRRYGGSFVADDGIAVLFDDRNVVLVGQLQQFITPRQTEDTGGRESER